MTNLGNLANPPATHRRRLSTLPIASTVIAVLAIVVFLNVGSWLVVEDPLAKAQAIAVLSGRMPLRALEAAKIYREGYAAEVWLTHSSEPGETLKAMDIPFIGEESYNRQILIHEGVPADAIHVLDPPIVNTADEMKVIAAKLEQEKGRTVILVTSKVHTRRARLLWRKFSARRGHAIVRAAAEDPFDPGHWWHNTGDALDVVREVLGVLNAWAGLPLHPAG